MSIANELNLSIGAEIDGLQKGLDQAGKELTKFEKKVQGLSKIGGQMQKIGGAMTIGISAPLIAIGTLATKAFAELEGVKTAFERLNDATLLDDLRKATKGTVSDFVLMKSAVRAENFEIPVKKLGTLLEFARRRAKDTGESVDYLVNSLVDGIGRKSTMILDNLGISATALSKELKGVGVASLSVGEVSEAVERIAKRSLDGMGKDVLTLTEQWLQVKTTIANSMTEIGAIIAPMLKPVIELVKSLADKFKNLSPEAKKLIVIFGGIAIAIGPVVAILGTVLVLLPSIIAGVGALGTAFTALMGPIGLVIAGIGAIIYAVVKNWDSIKPYIIGTINYFIELYNESENVRMAIQGLVLSFKIGFSAIKNIVSTAWEVFKSFAKATADIFGGIGTIIKGVFNRNFDEIKQGAADVSKAYLTGFKDIGKDIDTGIGSLFADIKKNTDKAVENLKKNKIPLITELFSSDPADIQAAKDNVNDDINEVINGVGIGGRQNVIPLNIEIAPSGIEKSKEGIKEFFDGIKRTYFTEGEIAAAEMKITNERISRGVSNIISGGLSILFQMLLPLLVMRLQVEMTC